MKEIQKRITEKELTGLTAYLSLYRKIIKETKTRDVVSEKEIRIALLSSFTIKGLKESLFIKCCADGIYPQIYLGDYNQYSQEILDSESKLYQFKPDLIFLFIDTRALLGERYFAPYSLTVAERKEATDEDLEQVKNLIETVKQRTSAKIIIHDLEVPAVSPMGILENKQEFGFFESIRFFNSELSFAYKKDSQVFIYEYDKFLSAHGKNQSVDKKLYYLGDIKLDLQLVPELAEEYMSFIMPFKAKNRKCIVLDLDNTLWGGIIGEDGIEGIKLGPTPEGRPFIEFQKYLLALFNRGVILAVNSKNNREDAMNVFQNHPYMILKEEHFAAMKINWTDKISNMKAIAKEINIGLNSLVFFDDDKQNRSMIKDALPEVLVVDLPDDPAEYLKTLTDLNYFNTLQLTEEDRKKGQMYAQQRGRNEIKLAATDITEYLRALKIKVTIEKADKFNIPRISQLTLKTNQFNLTTRRYQEEDIRRFSGDENFFVFAAKVEDRFGDNGITGVAIVRKKHKKWEIDTFLLSCRVIGRKIEEVMLKHILDKAAAANIEQVIGSFIPTKKNLPACHFFEKNGFAKAKENDDAQHWVYKFEREYLIPDYIEVKEK